MPFIALQAVSLTFDLKFPNKFCLARYRQGAKALSEPYSHSRYIFLS
jgi:hypothetical protein